MGADRARRRQAHRAIPVGTNVVRSRLYDFHRLHITIKAADDYYMLLCTYVLCFCWFGGDRLSYIPYIRFIGVMLCQFRLREGREVFNTLFLAGRLQALPRGAVIHCDHCDQLHVSCACGDGGGGADHSNVKDWSG